MHPIAHLLPVLLCLIVALPVSAADKPVRVKPSKVSSAKQREREKLFTEWMPLTDMKATSDKKGQAGEQMIYFEYHEGKRAYRGIFTKALKLNGWWWDVIYGEKEMEKEVASYKGRGYEPLFVVLEGNYYRALFVKPEQLEAARKIILEFGIEPPVVK